MSSSLLAENEFTYARFKIDAPVRELCRSKLETANRLANSVCKLFLKGQCRQEVCNFEHIRFQKDVVCKHWFAGKCKLDEKCSKLHEYDMSKMEVCTFFSDTQTCNKGDDCPFLHVTADERKQDCPWYDRGFCKHGAMCRNRHNRKDACSNYLTGFCPLGAECPLGHPKLEAPVDSDGRSSGAIVGSAVTGTGGAGGGGAGGFANIICNRCSMPGHKAVNCPNGGGGGGARNAKFDNIKCYRCQQMGHFANQCTADGGQGAPGGPGNGGQNGGGQNGGGQGGIGQGGTQGGGGFPPMQRMQPQGMPPPNFGGPGGAPPAFGAPHFAPPFMQAPPHAQGGGQFPAPGAPMQMMPMHMQQMMMMQQQQQGAMMSQMRGPMMGAPMPPSQFQQMQQQQQQPFRPLQPPPPR